MKVIFYKAEYGNWNDKIIAWWTNSPYSHVEIVMEDGRCFSASGREDIVRFKQIDYDTSGHWDIVETDLIINNIKLEKILNKKYDFKGIWLNEVLPLSMHHKDKWYCSEACSHVLDFSDTLINPGELYEYLTKN